MEKYHFGDILIFFLNNLECKLLNPMFNASSVSEQPDGQISYHNISLAFISSGKPSPPSFQTVVDWGS